MLPNHSSVTDDAFFSPVSFIRNVAVVGLPEGGKNRSDSGPEWPQVAFFGRRAGDGHGAAYVKK
jgi:hypothetical protein